jgi:CheY-like chemotaxis protein
VDDARGNKPAGRVLVIDDDVVALELLGASLRSAGYDVVARAAAPTLTDVRRMGIDAVVCDLCMSGVDGEQVVMTFHNDDQLRDVPFVLVSADAQRLARSLERMPWLHCAAKDAALMTLVSTLEKLIERARLKKAEPPSGKHKFAAEPGTGKFKALEPGTGKQKAIEPGTGKHKFSDYTTGKIQAPSVTRPTPDFSAGPPERLRGQPAPDAGRTSPVSVARERERGKQRFFESLRERAKALRPFLIGGVLGPRAHEEVQKQFRKLRDDANSQMAGATLNEMIRLCERLTERAQRDLRAMELLGACNATLSTLDENTTLPLTLDALPGFGEAKQWLG